MDGDNELSFMTWNSHGLKTKIHEAKTEIEKCDVAFIQETHIGERHRNLFIEEFDEWESVFTVYNPRSRGVAILIKTNILEQPVIWHHKDAAGRFVVVKCTLKGQLYTLVSVYIPQNDRECPDELRKLVEKSKEGILLIGGDFNLALNPYLDKNSLKLNNQHSMLKPAVERLITFFHLVDVWRRLHPICRKYTYSKYFSQPYSRLDYVFVPEESMQYVESCRISENECCSDHQPVLFKIRCIATNTSNDLDVIERTDRTELSTFVSNVLEQWLACKQEFWGDGFNLTFSQDAFTNFQVTTIETTIQSLAITKNKVKRPDDVSLLFYKCYSFALIPYLCVFYHNFLKQTENVIESFRRADQISGTPHYIYNVDYLILATIMASWLNKHLQSRSTNYTIDIKKKVVFAFKKESKEIAWSFLEQCLRKEQERASPQCFNFNIDVLNKLLQNSSCGTKKLLHWGCPLTPVLKRLYLTHAAEKFLKNAKQLNSGVYISRENVIVRVSGNVRDLLQNVKGKFTLLHCELVSKLTNQQSESNIVARQKQS